MRYDEFIEWSLYDSVIGYYQQKRQRVGKQSTCDFYTSRNIGKLWGELILSSCLKILGSDHIADYCFVEIACEPDRETLMKEHSHPFKSIHSICLNDKIEIPANSIVFSNEWLDSQPFRRFSFSASLNQWVELGVCLKNNQLKETVFSEDFEEAYFLPKKVSDGYILDWPSGSAIALRSLLNQSEWKGLFLTFDYGLPLNTILYDRPEGTARAYKKQTMSTDLLIDPGSQDLTCHLCWDLLTDELKSNGFDNVVLQTQESYFLNHARKHIQKIFSQKKHGLDQEMQSLRELIHPAHLGHGLQALWVFVEKTLKIRAYGL